MKCRNENVGEPSNLTAATSTCDIEIVVISLARCMERRRAIKAQMVSLGLSFRFFDAIDGAVGHPLFSKNAPNEAQRIGAKPLSSGQLGCWASHYIVWQECVNSGRPFVVLEDDAILDNMLFPKFLSSIAHLPGEVECLRLFASKARNKKYMPIKTLPGGLVVGKFLRGHISATGYYLTPSGATKLLKYTKDWREPVDVAMDQFWINGVECYGIDPPILTHNAEFPSAIDVGRNGGAIFTRAGMKKVRWRVYQIHSRLCRNLHNLSFYLRH